MDTFNLDLGGETVQLHVDADAALGISNNLGGLFAAFNAIQALNIEAVTEIIHIGSRLPAAEKKAQRQRVFDTGLTKVVGPVADYLSLLINGGQPPTPSEGVNE